MDCVASFPLSLLFLLTGEDQEGNKASGANKLLRTLRFAKARAHGCCDADAALTKVCALAAVQTIPCLENGANLQTISYHQHYQPRHCATLRTDCQGIAHFSPKFQTRISRAAHISQLGTMWHMIACVVSYICISLSLSVSVADFLHRSAAETGARFAFCRVRFSAISIGASVCATCAHNPPPARVARASWKATRMIAFRTSLTQVHLRERRLVHMVFVRLEGFATRVARLR